MNHFSASHKTQGIRSQNPCLSKPSSGVCLQNTYDYSPFGVSLDERTMEGDFYRRGYNGMEKDKEIKGEGNSINYKFRMHDPRIGRFLSVDPLTAEMPSWSTYNFCFGNPIIYVDPDGRAPQDWIKNKDGKYIWDKTVTNPKQVHDGQKYIGKESSDIVKDLFGRTSFSAHTSNSGSIGSESGSNWVATSYASAYTTLNVRINANVSYDGKNRTFNGVDVHVSGGSWTWDAINVYQALEFTTTSLMLNGKEMKKDSFQPTTIGPQQIYYKTADIKGHTNSISATKVYSAREASNNISISMSGQITFGDVPLKGYTILGSIITNPTYISLNIPYKK